MNIFGSPAGLLVPRRADLEVYRRQRTPLLPQSKLA